MRHLITGMVSAAIVLSVLPANAASVADKCEAGKQKIVGSYFACYEKAVATGLAKGSPPDTGKCALKFNDKWANAETKGSGMCPDNVATAASMNAYIVAQAQSTVAIIAGTSNLPVCGDGLINVVGEQCDGSAVDGYACSSFGRAGAFGCTAGCDFDSSGCYECPGFVYAEECWLLGASGLDCNATCAAEGMVYDTATDSVAGSAGTDSACKDIFDGLGVPGVGIPLGSFACGPGLSLGCVVSGGFRTRCMTPAPTTPTASGPGYERVCACH
jgi:hypothetical protein